MSKSTDERTTPMPVYEAICTYFHVMPTLDVCATKASTRCREWFGPGSPLAIDAFHTPAPWHALTDIAWMNPPYSEITPWLATVLRNTRAGPYFRCLTLLPSSTSAAWFHRFIWNHKQSTWRPYIIKATFWPRRIDFEPHTTGAKWPSIVVLFGQH